MGHARYLEKIFVVEKDEAHVPYEPLHRVLFLGQPFLHQVQPHGFLKGLAIVVHLGAKPPEGGC